MSDIKDKEDALKEKIPEKTPEKQPEQFPKVAREKIEIPKAVPAKTEKKDIVTGTVISQDIDGYYQIQVGERQLRIKAAVSETLLPNEGVVLGKSSIGYYVIGTEKYKARKRKIVTITG